MKKLLAKVTIPALSRAALDELVQANKAKSQLQLQDHVTVDGSLDERISRVNAAFRKWLSELRGNDDLDYDWYWWSTTVLAIFDTCLVFCVYSQGGYCYYSVDYTSGANGEVTITGDLAQVNVRMVVETLGVNDEMTEQSAKEAMEEQKETQNSDTVTPSKAVASTVVSSPVNHDGDNPNPAGSAETAADEKGGNVPVKPGDVSTAQVEHDGDNGAGEGPAGNSNNGVNAELAKTAAGYKGENASENNYAGKDTPYNQDFLLGNPEFLIQSTSFSKAGESLCFIQSKKVVEVEGKKVLRIQGVGTRADIINAEGVVYPLEVWQDKNLARMNAQAAAGKFLGKLEHPKVEQGLVDAAIKFNKFWMQGSDVWFEADVIPTEPHGKNLQALIDAGVQIDMSTRGYGTTVQGTWRGQDVRIIQQDFICVGIDAVQNGASTGSSVTSANYQSTTDATNLTQENKNVNPDENLTPAQKQAADLRAKAAVGQYRTDLIGASGLSDMGSSIYAQALAGCETLESIYSTSESLLPVLQGQFPAQTKDAQVQSATWSPTYIAKSSAEEQAPKTVGEMFDRLVADLPDSWKGQSKPTNMASHFQSPQAACKRLMINIARADEGGFNGGRAALGLLALEQGRMEKAKDILEQSLASGATTAGGNADPGGAPLSAPLIFPLVRRVFPRYIMGEIAAIQPMDRPEGKIFYKDAYRTNDPTVGNVDTRIDLNTSSNPFNTSYSDNSTEGSAAQLIRMKLASITVQAYTKKLGAAWSVEEMQDLRAYHGLDASQELMGDVAREVALEWNGSVLNDMAANATASIATYGTTMPGSGFQTQEQWDAYLWVYLQNMDNKIFQKRNGPMTHLIVGADAALAMSKSMRGTFTIGGENGGDMELYPGTQFFGSVQTPVGTYKIFKTNFWGSGTPFGNYIMGLRRGQEWSDTPYVWAPYTDYVTPVLTDPSDYSQKQGIVSRAAKQVVVGDAIALLKIMNQQGAILS